MSIVDLDRDRFEQDVLKGSGVALVDFWAPWCSYCILIAPMIDQLAERMEGKALIGKINTDEETELSLAHGILGIPALLIYKDGQEVARKDSRATLDELEDLLVSLL